jgi:glutamyl-Q tRNA(Asp) synthetase
MQQSAQTRTGRFAPTPSGPLHFGSLVAAVASYCQSKSVNGNWLVRIEDIDTPRVIKGSADNILHTLENFGFEWDGEVLYQSQRFKIYEEFLQTLISQGFIYACNCSRKSLLGSPIQTGPLGKIYPGNCRTKQLDLHTLKLRLNTETVGSIEFHDNHFDTFQLNLTDEVGDIILKRQDGVYAYHLAVVIDDALSHITDIVRGADLLGSTCIHLHLNRLFKFSTANYLHIPLIKNKTGDKLSKQTGAKGLSIQKAPEQILDALNFLGQKIPAELSTYEPSYILKYAKDHWDSKKIPS